MRVFKYKNYDIVISDEVWYKKFSCNLNLCKGACCKYGDRGAVLFPEEIDRLTKLIPKLSNYLPKHIIELISNQLYEEHNGKFHIREIAPNYPCPLSITDENKTILCSLHFLASNLKVSVTLLKPLWCQLYPLIVTDTPTGCIINWHEGEHCVSQSNANYVLLSFGNTLSEAFGKEFIDNIKSQYISEGLLKF